MSIVADHQDEPKAVAGEPHNDLTWTGMTFNS